MRECDLKRLQEAPVPGTMLAYTRSKVIFCQYESMNEVSGRLSGQELLELHLFDSDREYRCIMTRSPRYEGGVIEAVVDFPEEDALSVYKECVLLEHMNGGGTITVLNHLKYKEENGMIAVDNYRLRMGER